jgi:hypothetical protein
MSTTLRHLDHLPQKTSIYCTTLEGERGFRREEGYLVCSGVKDEEQKALEKEEEDFSNWSTLLERGSIYLRGSSGNLISLIDSSNLSNSGSLKQRQELVRKQRQELEHEGESISGDKSWSGRGEHKRRARAGSEKERA